MDNLLQDISQCTICKELLPHDPRPVVAATENSKIWIVGQAPGSKVHKTGIPWDDQSGKQLRKWLGVDEKTFYNPNYFGLIPMGFCYPGKGKTGDLPPRKECAPQWHPKLKEQMQKPALIILIGQYAQKDYLKDRFQKNLTETVKQYYNYLPDYIPLPHPSPRNRFWLTKNPWFEDVIQLLQLEVKKALKQD